MENCLCKEALTGICRLCRSSGAPCRRLVLRGRSRKLNKSNWLLSWLLLCTTRHFRMLFGIVVVALFDCGRLLLGQRTMFFVIVKCGRCKDLDVIFLRWRSFVEMHYKIYVHV